MVASALAKRAPLPISDSDQFRNCGVVIEANLPPLSHGIKDANVSSASLVSAAVDCAVAVFAVRSKTGYIRK